MSVPLPFIDNVINLSDVTFENLEKQVEIDLENYNLRRDLWAINERQIAREHFLKRTDQTDTDAKEAQVRIERAGEFEKKKECYLLSSEQFFRFFKPPSAQTIPKAPPFSSSEPLDLQLDNTFDIRLLDVEQEEDVNKNDMTSILQIAERDPISFLLNFFSESGTPEISKPNSSFFSYLINNLTNKKLAEFLLRLKYLFEYIDDLSYEPSEESSVHMEEEIIVNDVSTQTETEVNDEIMCQSVSTQTENTILPPPQIMVTKNKTTNSTKTITSADQREYTEQLFQLYEIRSAQMKFFEFIEDQQIDHDLLDYNFFIATIVDNKLPFIAKKNVNFVDHLEKYSYHFYLVMSSRLEENRKRIEFYNKFQFHHKPQHKYYQPKVKDFKYSEKPKKIFTRRFKYYSHLTFNNKTSARMLHEYKEDIIIKIRYLIDSIKHFFSKTYYNINCFRNKDGFLILHFNYDFKYKKNLKIDKIVDTIIRDKFGSFNSSLLK
jgi:hypothetical protein